MVLLPPIPLPLQRLILNFEKICSQLLETIRFIVVLGFCFFELAGIVNIWHIGIKDAVEIGTKGGSGNGCRDKRR